MVILISLAVVFLVPAAVSAVAQFVACKGRWVTEVSWGGKTPKNAIRGDMIGSDFFVR